MKPAAFVIRRFGGVRACARAVKRNPSSVSRWKATGQIPESAHKSILRAAKKYKLNVKPHNLIYGGKA